MPPNSFFITGTGTGVGKTITCAALLTGLRQLGLTPHYHKLVQTGPQAEDRRFIKNLLPDITTHFEYAWYPDPMSPDQAALRQGQSGPSLDSLITALQNPAGFTLFEGAGGLMVPLNHKAQTWLDLLHHVPLPTIIVASTQLGTLNHTALSIQALESRAVPLAAVILSGPEHPENLESLKRLFPQHQDRFLWLPQLECLNTGSITQAAASTCTELAKALLKITEPTPTKLHSEHSWHPFTQHKTAPQPLTITRAKGSWLYDQSGHAYLDATASWWVNSIGHGHPKIAAAISQQQQALDHIIFAGASHAPATALSDKLIAATAGDFTRVFYTDNGSCAVEVGVKMAIQHFANQGTPRHKIITLESGYHGDTFGAMSLSGTEGFHQMFQHQMFETIKLAPFTNHPSIYTQDRDLSQALTELDDTFAEHGSAIAALVIEPFIQGAGGMLMQDETWLKALCDKAHACGALVVFDEVFAGMGRLGHLFAYQRMTGLKPDILCLAKGLTGGNLPLAVTLANHKVFSAFYSDQKQHALLHGHTFTANPIGCAAALATLEIYEQEGLLQRARKIEERFHSWLRHMEQELGIENPRCCGMVLAFEWPGSGVGDYFAEEQSRIVMAAREKRVLLRPLGNTVYFVPSLTMTDEELEFGLEAMQQMLSAEKR